MLDYVAPQPRAKIRVGHWRLINTLCGYGAFRKCSKCGIVMESKKQKKWKRHMRKHKTEDADQPCNYKFRKGKLRAQKTTYERTFGKPRREVFFGAFDFEAITRKTLYKHKNDTYRQNHEPCGIVSKWWFDDVKVQFRDLKYKGADCAEKFCEFLAEEEKGIVKYKKKRFFRENKALLIELEKSQCNCGSKALKHTGYCNKGYENETYDDTHDKCICTLEKKHTDKCRYSQTLKSLISEATKIPILIRVQ